jgi:hypothetical protein
VAGYRRPSKVFRLIFTDPEMEGLEVRAKSMPIGKLMEVVEIAALSKGGRIDVRDASKIKVLFETFADALLSWNLVDDDDAPVPADLNGLWAQDLDFVLNLIAEWMTAIAGVPGPLPQPSPDGVQSVEGLIPMVALSNGQPN